MTARPTPPVATIARLALCAVILGAVGGATSCRSGPKDFDNENDELRRKLTDAEDRILVLEAERNELAAKVDELSATFAGTSGEPAADVVASLPRCAGLTLGRLSGPVDSDDDGFWDRVDLYIKPFDGRRRFVQIAGRLDASATLVPPPGSVGGGPKTLGSATLRPIDLREAYRSSPLGTHYTVEIPIDRTPVGSMTGSLLLSAEFRDAVTGKVHSVQETVSPGAPDDAVKAP